MFRALEDKPEYILATVPLEEIVQKAVDGDEQYIHAIIYKYHPIIARKASQLSYLCNNVGLMTYDDIYNQICTKIILSLNKFTGIPK